MKMCFQLYLEKRRAIIFSLLLLCFVLNCTKDKSIIASNDDHESDSHNTSKYILPYPVGTEYQCIQGNSEGDHVNLYEYAQDFAMPVNSYITAVRKGQLIYVKEDAADNNQSDINLLIIEHYDGSCAFYLHLKNNGVLVTDGGRVSQGDTIALSGNTGYTNNISRLGFYVKEGPFDNQPTIPVSFRNTISHPDGIQSNINYPALSYESDEDIADTAENIGIPVSTPGEQGIDGDKLNELLVKIKDGDYGEVHSLLIARNDTLVLEQYFNGFHRDDIHFLYSATKSFTSALIGIAIDEGKILSVDEKMVSFFPEYNILNNDSLKKSITLKHLLTMTSGLSLSHQQQAYASNNWISAMLNIPMEFLPGEKYEYITCNTLLLGGIINYATGMDANEYAAQKLFEPLGIQHWFWAKGPGNAIATGGWLGGLHLRPLDMLKFGLLFLNKGKWNGKTVISEKWVNESTSQHIPFSPNPNYCYQWKLTEDHGTIGRLLEINDVFFAHGAREQFIFVIPHLDVVVVLTAWDAAFKDMMHDYIIPAIIN